MVLPKYTKEHRKSHELLIQVVSGCPSSEYNEIVDELLSDERFNSFVNNQFAVSKLADRFPQDRYSWPITLYFLIRHLRPEVIVETGVWYGVSTAHILAALKRNGTGKLYSIDLPAYDDTGGYRDENPYLCESDRIVSLPTGKQPGFIVPEWLQENWHLTLGDSTTELPEVLRRLACVDIFLHDSLHSYQHMSFELGLARQFTKRGGFIASDNIDWNDAFNDFATKHRLITCTYLAYYESPMLKHNFGLILV
jgi:predicted O-methyltransferase YrrM